MFSVVCRAIEEAATEFRENLPAWQHYCGNAVDTFSSLRSRLKSVTLSQRVERRRIEKEKEREREETVVDANKGNAANRRFSELSFSAFDIAEDTSADSYSESPAFSHSLLHPFHDAASRALSLPTRGGVVGKRGGRLPMVRLVTYISLGERSVLIVDTDGRI